MKTWTKILLAVLSLVMVVSLVACKPAEQPAESTPEASEPKATEPEATEPEATEPEATEPDATEPATSDTEPADTTPSAPAVEATDFTEAVQGFFTGDLLNGKVIITNGALSTTLWTGTTLDGYAIMSGNAGKDDSTSAIKFPISVTAEALLKFNLKVDAGADTADYVYIVLNGARFGLDNFYNGEYEVAIPLTAGDHEITIAYRKDATANAATVTDAAFISKMTVVEAPFAVTPIDLEMVAAAPDQFADCEKLEVETLAYTLNGASVSTVGDRGIIYIKKSHDYPRASIKFTVEEAGTYEILIVIGGKNRPTAVATGITQVDDGQKYYLNSPCEGTEGDAEYFVGMTVELTAGEHDFHMYLAPDFNDGDVKSIYFDYICIAKK